MKVKQPFEIPHEGSELERTARRKIDDEIDKIERTVQSLRATRNKLCSTSALPDEVLTRIFILVRNLSARSRAEDRQISWIRVGQVCHHWREVALRRPGLWSAPFFTRPDLAREMMQRSKTAPLTIESNAFPSTTRVFEQVQYAMAQIHRIKFLELMLFCVQQSIFSPLLQPAPILEEISLCDIVPLVEGSQLSFPPDALSCAPRLQRINFDHLNLSWESAVFKHRNLTHLRLTNNCGTSTFSQMMGALYHLPDLRILKLTKSIPSHTTSDGSERISEFKFLEQLDLIAEAMDCILFLRHIQYPPRVMVKVHSLSAGVEDSTTIFSLIGQKFRRIQRAGAGSSPVIIRSAQLMFLDTRSLKIDFFDVVDEKSHDPLTESFPKVMIFLDGGSTLDGAHGRLLTSLFNSFSFPLLQELTLGWTFNDSEIHVIQNIFGRLQKLKFIGMLGGSIPQICNAIAENPEGVSAEHEGSEKPQTSDPPRSRPQRSYPPVTIFPALEMVMVGCVNFRYFPERMDHLIDMLIKRSNMNAPIDRLYLEVCRGVGTRHKRQLGELVAHLEVENKVIDVRELEFDNSDSLSDEDEDEGTDSEDYSSSSTSDY